MRIAAALLCRPVVVGLLIASMAADMVVDLDAISVSSGSSLEFVDEKPMSVSEVCDVSYDELLDQTPPEILWQPSWFSNPEDVVGPLQEDTLYDWVLCGCPLILIPLIIKMWSCIEACGRV